MNADELAVCKASSACQDTVYTHAYGSMFARARADNIKLHLVDISSERRDEGCESEEGSSRAEKKKKKIYTDRCKK